MGNRLHPQPLLDAIWDFKLPEHGLPQIAPELKRRILNGNVMRILDLDVDPLRTPRSHSRGADRQTSYDRGHDQRRAAQGRRSLRCRDGSP